MRKIFLTLLVFIAPLFIWASPSRAQTSESCRITGTVTQRQDGSFNLGVSVYTRQLNPGSSYSITLDTGVRKTVNHAFNPPPENDGVNFAFQLDSGHADKNFALYVRPTSCVDVSGTGCAIDQCTTRVYFNPSAPITSDDPSPDEVLPNPAPAPTETSVYEFCRQVPEGPQRRECEACVGGDGTDVNEKIYTAFGCLNVSGSGLASDIIRLFLGIAGGVALISILFAAMTFATSQGDTNKVKQAKEMLTAAVSGLFFIIFSIIILNFVGVTILRIPGLG